MFLEHSSALKNTKTKGLGIWETMPMMMIALEVGKKRLAGTFSSLSSQRTSLKPTIVTKGSFQNEEGN